MEQQKKNGKKRNTRAGRPITDRKPAINNEQKKNKRNVNRRNAYNAKKGRRRGNVVAPSLVGTVSSADLPTGVAKNSFIERGIKKYALSGPDARDPNQRVNVLGTEFVAGQSGSIPYILYFSDEAARAYVCGVISNALVMGWRATLDVNTASYPFFAANYMLSLIYNVANGDDSRLPATLPVFFRDMLAIIRPKSGSRFYTGDLSFKWTTSSTIPTVPDHFAFPVGAATYSFWIPKVAGGLADGFPEMAVPVSPTGEQGAIAFNSMINYCADQIVRDEGEFNPWMPATTMLSKSVLYTDISAFCQTVPQIGQACGRSAFQSGILSPKKIHAPKFAVFANNTAPDQTIGWRHGRIFSGDACSLASSQLLQVHQNEYFNADPPSFKYIDFYDLANRLLVSICSAWSLMHRQSTNTSIPVNLGMTMTQFLCMFRAVLMGFFNYQQYGQSVLPVLANSSAAAKIMLPFIVSTPTSNGYPYTTMSLPLYFLENVKSLMISAVEDQFNPNTNKTVQRHKHYRVPVLFVYKDAAVDWTSYTYDNGEEQVKIFTAAGATISVIDGSSGNSYYDISDSSNVNALLALWNATVNALSPCIQQLAASEIDPAPNALTLIQTTKLVDSYRRNNYEKFFLETYVIMEKKKSDKGTPEIVLMNKGWASMIAEQPYLRPLFSISGNWVSPELPLFDGEAGTGYGKISANFSSVYYREPQYAPLTNSIGATQRLIQNGAVVATYAQSCAKTYNAEDSEQVKLLLKVSETGEGGFFTSVVRKFAVPVIKNVGMTAMQALAAQLGA